MFSPAERSLRGRIGAHVLHARYGPEISEQGRVAAAASLDARLAAEYCLDAAALGPVEFARRLSHARSAYFAQLALKSAQARRARARRRRGSPRN